MKFDDTKETKGTKKKENKIQRDTKVQKTQNHTIRHKKRRKETIRDDKRQKETKREKREKKRQ